MRKALVLLCIWLLVLSCNKSSEAVSSAAQNQHIEPQDTDTLSHEPETDENSEIEAAAQARDFDAVIALLNKGLDPNTMLKDGNTLLTWAIRNKAVEVIKVLFEKKANVNLRTNPGSTIREISLGGYSPWRIALSEASDEIVFLLLEQDIDWDDVEDPSFYRAVTFNAFEYAIVYGRITVLWKLLQIDEAVKSAINTENLSIDFIYYWSDGLGEIMDELIARGFVLDTNRDLLYWAIWENEYGAVKWLLDHGFSPIENLRDDVESHLENALYRRHGLGVLEGTQEDKDESLRIIELLKEHTDEQYIPALKEKFPYFAHILD